MARIKPKKHLGQHFLTDTYIAKKIVDALINKNGCLAIEIGAGTGVLTQYLLEKESDFIAFDVDIRSIDFLKNRYASQESLFCVQDYLEYEVNVPVVIIGNFPYNLSSQLLFKIWEERAHVGEVVCMVQKEVAQRIASPHGSKAYGILSVLLQSFFEVDYLFEVPPSAFLPPPKVQSAVIRLTRNTIKKLPCDELLLKKIVKAGFGKRRKTLRNALKYLDLHRLDMSDELLDRRAEQLSVADFISLTLNASAR